MGFFEAIQTCFRKYGTFSGRARRREYWFWAVFNGIIFMIFYGIIMVQFVGVLADMPQEELMKMDPDSDAEVMIMLFKSSGAVLIAMLAYGLVIFVPSLAVSVRRLHDIGKSGWYYLVNFIPYVGALIFMIFALMDSQPGENLYGPNPKENPDTGSDGMADSSVSSNPFGE